MKRSLKRGLGWPVVRAARRCMDKAGVHTMRRDHATPVALLLSGAPAPAATDSAGAAPYFVTAQAVLHRESPCAAALAGFDLDLRTKGASLDRTEKEKTAR